MIKNCRCLIYLYFCREKSSRFENVIVIDRKDDREIYVGRSGRVRGALVALY